MQLFKRTLDSFIVVLFLMCMFFALSATLDNMTVATERPYLLQGEILLISVGILIAVSSLMRGMSFLKYKISRITTDWIARIWFLAVFAAGIYVRIRVIITIPITPSSDFDTYFKLGELLVNGKLLNPESQQLREYVSMFPHTIGFPMLVLKPVFSLFGVSIHAALYANLMCSMISVLLMYGIGCKIAGRRAGLAAMTLMSLWPSHVLFSSMIASDPSFTCYLLGGTYLIALGIDRGENSLYKKQPVMGIIALIAAGAAIGIANAIRPMAAILLIAVVLCLLIDTRFKRAPVDAGGPRQILSIRWLSLMLVLVSFFLTNLFLTQNVTKAIGMQPTGGISSSGYNLLVGINVENNGVWNQENADFFSNEYTQTGSAQKAQQACLDQAIQYFLSRPEDVLNLVVYKFRDMWKTDDFGISWNLLWTEQQGLLTDSLNQQLQAVRPIGRMMYFCLLALAGIGGIRQLMRRDISSIFRISMLFFLGTAALHMVLETQVRYHYTALAFLMLAAVCALMKTCQTETAAQTAAAQSRNAILLHETGPNPTAPAQPASPSNAPDIADAIRKGHIVITATQKSSHDFHKMSSRENP